MDNKNFLFELGTEEIPAAYINNAVQKLEEGITQALKDNKLTYKELKVYSTPRRMALLINSLQSKQADEIIEKVGPAKKIAVDENGELTKSGMGFVKGAKASVEDVFFKETAKGEYIAPERECRASSNSCSSSAEMYLGSGSSYSINSMVFWQKGQTAGN